MKICLNETVLEAGLNRIRYLFDEFPNVVVGFSGGKDSTTVLNLALMVAREKNRLPLSVMFLDQEAEWKGTIDYVTEVMTSPEVKPFWYQMPIVITNNASSYERYSYCWDEKQKEFWIHEKHEVSKKENIYNEIRFHNMFSAIFKVEFPGVKSCYLSGVRTAESPKRYVSLTEDATYKHITWARHTNKEHQHYTFYPLYDWGWRDVWKFIHDNNLNYNKVYDKMWQHGVRVQDMRISNLHHETAVQVLMLVQEIEPDTWDKLTKRIKGIGSIKHIKRNSFAVPKTLPYMFRSWEEYALYLIDNIIQEEKNRERLLHVINNSTRLGKQVFTVSSPEVADKYWKKIIDTVLSSDWDLTKLTNFSIDPDYIVTKHYSKKEFHKIKPERLAKERYLTKEQKQEVWNALKGQ